LHIFLSAGQVCLEEAPLEKFPLLKRRKKHFSLKNAALKSPKNLLGHLQSERDAKFHVSSVIEAVLQRFLNEKQAITVMNGVRWRFRNSVPRRNYVLVMRQ
jgi:hypothetical protein